MKLLTAPTLRCLCCNHSHCVSCIDFVSTFLSHAARVKSLELTAYDCQAVTVIITPLHGKRSAFGQRELMSTSGSGCGVG